MFFVPAWVTNIILLVTCWLSAYQLLRLQRPNPLVIIQFYMILFCLAIVLSVALYNRVNPWWSLAFLLIAVINLGVMVRQNRMLPPRRRLE